VNTRGLRQDSQLPADPINLNTLVRRAAA
jgi:hypothetical protein